MYLSKHTNVTSDPFTGEDELEAELKELEEQLLQPASTVPSAPVHVPAGKQPARPIP
ncbi:hypothetical protein KY289_001078 [Solanum tuberosum]|nr:hypothetical protein KY289_001078 [Solanum tuberosum]